MQRQARTLAKLIKEMRPKADAPTKDAVAAVAIAETENKVPMFIMHVASMSEFVIFWLACTKTTWELLISSCPAMQRPLLLIMLQERQDRAGCEDAAQHTRSSEICRRLKTTELTSHEHPAIAAPLNTSLLYTLITYLLFPTVELLHACKCLTRTRVSARSLSRARTRSLRSPSSSRRMVTATSSIRLGPLKRFTTARFCTCTRAWVRRAGRTASAAQHSAPAPQAASRPC